MSRRLTREAVLKALFQVDVGEIEPGKALDYALEGLFLNDGEKSFASELFSGTLKASEEIDRYLTFHLVKWELKRIAAVDRSILRMAIFEIIYLPDVPPAVTINEAVELAKKYSNPESVAFINGVLDKISVLIAEKR